MYLIFFFKHHCYGCKMAVLRRVTFHSMFWNPHSFESMLGSSCPEVACKKFIIKSFTKFTGKLPCRSPFFLRKKTPVHVCSCEFSEIFLQNICKRPPLYCLSKCSLLSIVIYMFSDFSEKKTNCKSVGNTSIGNTS